MINTLLILLMSCPINSTSSARSALPDFLQTFHKFHNLDTGLDLRRLTSGFHEAFATGAASQQGTFTLPDIWFRSPFGDLLMLQLLRLILPNLPYLFSTFHLEYPSVLTRLALQYRYIWSTSSQVFPVQWGCLNSYVVWRRLYHSGGFRGGGPGGPGPPFSDPSIQCISFWSTENK